MRSLTFALLTCVFVLSACNFPNEEPARYYYHYNGTDTPLWEDHNSITVKIDQKRSAEVTRDLSALSAYSIQKDFSNDEYLRMSANPRANNAARMSALSMIRALDGVISANYNLWYNSSLIGYTDEFLARMTGDASMEEFREFLDQHGVKIDYNFPYDERLFLLTIPKGDNLLNMVEKFRQSPLISNAEPNFIIPVNLLD